MAAGREAARAAAIEVISDGLFFFEWVQSRLYAGVVQENNGLETQQSWRRFRSFTMRHRWTISVRASVALFLFGIGK